MDTNNWRPQPQGGAGEPALDSGDWRTQLQPDSRQRIVNKIMETLKRHLPFSGQEGLLELKKIAVRFEEKIYSAATSQSDYLRKISLKMLTMETKSQNSIPNNPNGNRPAEPECWIWNTKSRAATSWKHKGELGSKSFVSWKWSFLLCIWLFLCWDALL